MGWLDKLFGKDSEPAPETAPVAAVDRREPFAGLEGIRFGRYSDNNKSFEKTQRWYLAEDCFKQGAYAEAFAAFFDYIRDDDEENVSFQAEGEKFSFELVQGSKKVYGRSDGSQIVAKACIAVMERPTNAVMRRLLEMNFSLCYSRCALDENNTLCMIFETPVAKASPNKLYYGLREIAKHADRQDDLLIADFDALSATDSGHIQPLPPAELELKYAYFRKWIEESLRRADALNADSFSGAISYILLSLLYRIDFLLLPEAAMVSRLEMINELYWKKKDEVTVVERNARMKEAIRKLLDITPEAFRAGAYRSKSTFATRPLPAGDKIREHIQGANRDALWYIDNKHPEIALLINEYGMLYNQFLFSMPRVVTELTTIYTAVLHAGFFRELGLKAPFYDPETKTFDSDLINRAIDEAIASWPGKFTGLRWDHSRDNYSSLWDFALAFSEQVANLNLETRR